MRPNGGTMYFELILKRADGTVILQEKCPADSTFSWGGLLNPNPIVDEARKYQLCWFELITRVAPVKP